MNSAANLSRLLAWIAWPSRFSVPIAWSDGVQESVLDGCPGSAVGAMSTIETSPGMCVVGDVSRPWKLPPITAMRYRRLFAVGAPRGGNWTTMQERQFG
jgi:hypothetical protein